MTEFSLVKEDILAAAGLVDDHGFADAIASNVAGGEEFFVTNRLGDVAERREIPAG